jgi:hypothetical protein
MMRQSIAAVLGTLFLVTGASEALAQSGDRFVSEADRQLGSFRRVASSDYLRQQTVGRDTAVGGGLTGTTVRAPVSTTGGAPRRAATHGGGTVGTAMGPTRKPFSGHVPSPTVSPYMNLFRTDLGGNDDLNYQTLVQPQLRQQEFNRQFSIQEQQLNRRIQALSARNPYSEGIMPTGHGATHRYYSHFYPQLNRR